MCTINLDKHIWEGWRVRDFIKELEPHLKLIMSNKSWHPVIKTRKEMSIWCADNQPYYKKVIPDVVNYFCNKYNIN